MQKNVIMSVDHLSKDFVIRGKKLGEKSKLLHALSDVSFDIYEGETLGIIGESGCGKSTTARTVIKLIEPKAGTKFSKCEFWLQEVGFLGLPGLAPYP